MISSCSSMNFADMSNIFFKVRSVEFMMEFWLSRELFPMNVVQFIVAVINISPIVECSSPESATFDILSVFFALDLLLHSQILLHHFIWLKFRNLPLLGSWHYQVDMVDHESSLRTLRIVHISREECLHDEDDLNVPYTKKILSGFPDRSCVLNSLFHF